MRANDAIAKKRAAMTLNIKEHHQLSWTTMIVKECSEALFVQNIEGEVLPHHPHWEVAMEHRLRLCAG